MPTGLLCGKGQCKKPHSPSGPAPVKGGYQMPKCSGFRPGGSRRNWTATGLYPLPDVPAGPYHKSGGGSAGLSRLSFTLSALSGWYLAGGATGVFVHPAGYRIFPPLREWSRWPDSNRHTRIWRPRGSTVKLHRRIAGGSPAIKTFWQKVVLHRSL